MKLDRLSLNMKMELSPNLIAEPGIPVRNSPKNKILEEQIEKSGKLKAQYGKKLGELKTSLEQTKKAVQVNERQIKNHEDFITHLEERIRQLQDLQSVQDLVRDRAKDLAAAANQARNSENKLAKESIASTELEKAKKDIINKAIATDVNIAKFKGRLAALHVQLEQKKEELDELQAQNTRGATQATEDNQLLADDDETRQSLQSEMGDIMATLGELQKTELEVEKDPAMVNFDKFMAITQQLEKGDLSDEERTAKLSDLVNIQKANDALLKDGGIQQTTAEVDAGIITGVSNSFDLFSAGNDAKDSKTANDKPATAATANEEEIIDSESADSSFFEVGAITPFGTQNALSSSESDIVTANSSDFSLRNFLGHEIDRSSNKPELDVLNNLVNGPLSMIMLVLFMVYIVLSSRKRWLMMK